MDEELAGIIERALGKFPGSQLVAQGIVLAIRDAGLKVVRESSTEMRKRIVTPSKAKGGHVRAENLSPERRREIAEQGAAARWGKK